MSIDEQENVCRQACERYGWRVKYVLKDRLESAADLHRPQLGRLFEHADAGRVGVVVVWKLDRMWRSLRDAVNIFDYFTDSGIGFYSCTENFDNRSPFGRFVFRNVASAAELERELIRERTRMALHWRARQGLWLGRAPPFGYARDEAGGLRIDEAEAHVVRQIFGLYMRLKSMDAVARNLNGRDVLSRNDQPWTEYRLHRILRNPIYTGKLVIAEVEHDKPNLRIVSPQALVETKNLRATANARRASGHLTRRRADAIKAVFSQYERLLDDEEAAGHLPRADPLAIELEQLQREVADVE